MSGYARVQAAQFHKAAHVVGEVLHPDLGSGADHADHAYQGAALVVDLRAEDMFDPDTHGRFGTVAPLGLFSQWLSPLALAVDVAGQPSGAQLALDLIGLIAVLRDNYLVHEG